MSNINKAAVLKFYVDTQEYSDRLTAIEAQAASSIATHKTEVAAAIAQVNLAQSQTITALTLEVSNLKTNLTASITATQTDLINRADQLAQNVTNITQQLTQDKAAFTQEIQDALVYLENAESVASALRTPRKINGTDFDGRSDITTNAWGATRTFKIGNKANSLNGTSNVDYSLADIGAFPDVGGTIQGNVEVTGNLSVGGTISATLEGTAARADKLQVARKIQGVDFDGTKDINLPTFTTQTDGLVPKRVGATTTKYLREDGTWVVPPDTTYALLTAANAEAGTATSANSISAKVLKDAIKFHAPPATDITGNAGTATKLQTARTISLTGNVTGSASFDGSANASITTAITGLGVANGIATLDSSGQVPSTQLPSFVDDVLEYLNVAAFPATGESGKIYVETTGNTTYRWGGTGYVKITSGEVSSVAGKTGVVTLTKSDVGLANADNTADSVKNVASAAKLTTARTLGGVSFDGTANINLPGVNTAGNQSTTGNASTATTLQTARTINGTSFNGSANITTTNWGTARTLTLGSTGKSINGSADVSWSADEILPAGVSGQILKHNGTSWVAGTDNNILYSEMTAAEAISGTATTASLITPAVLKSAITSHAPVQTPITGNAESATKLQTARLINGIAFDGTGDINLDVYSKAETDSLVGTPDATETVAGKAKIATTAISKAGTNDTDIITALKLKQTLEASKSVLAGSVNFNGTGTISIRSQLNVSSITDSGVGKYRINMSTTMPNANYPVFVSVADRSNGAAGIGLEVKEQTTGSITVHTFVTKTGMFIDVDFISVGWTR